MKELTTVLLHVAGALQRLVTLYREEQLTSRAVIVRIRQLADQLNDTADRMANDASQPKRPA